MDTRNNGVLSDDITRKILLKLPINFVFRAKSVCKQWYNLISDEHFIQLHSAFASKKPIVLLMESPDIFMQSSLLLVDDDSKAVSVLSLNFLNHRVKVCASSNGVLFLCSLEDKNIFYVCNPITMKFKVLPECKEISDMSLMPHGHPEFVGFTFDLSILRFKVVLAGFQQIKRQSMFVCFAFDSYSGKWRKFDFVAQGCPKTMARPCVAFANGCFHWLIASHHPYVLALDLKSGCWRMILLPDKFCLTYESELSKNIPKEKSLYLLELDGALSVIEVSEKHLRIWVMNDRTRERWHLVDELYLDSRYMVDFTSPIYLTREHVFVKTIDQVLVYNRKSKEWKVSYSAKRKNFLPILHSAHMFQKIDLRFELQ